MHKLVWSLLQYDITFQLHGKEIYFIIYLIKHKRIIYMAGLKYIYGQIQAIEGKLSVYARIIHTYNNIHG